MKPTIDYSRKRYTVYTRVIMQKTLFIDSSIIRNFTGVDALDIARNSETRHEVISSIC